MRVLGTRTFTCPTCSQTVTMATSNRRIFCSAECKKVARGNYHEPFKVRALKPGEEIPDGQPLRYKTRLGYIKLRWRDTDGSFIEVFEHRVFNGRNTTAENVHHINHIRDDNRRENLQELTAAEHQDIHRREALEQYAQWKEMYEQGYSTVQVAEKHGTHAGNVYRGITELGATIRQAGDYRSPIPVEQVIRRYQAGEGAAAIARDLGVSYGRLIRTIEAQGIPRRPVGRVPERVKS